MKNVFLFLALVAFLAPKASFGYSSQAGNLPSSTTPEIETKSVIKKGSDAAYAAGIILSYDSASVDGFTVTNVGAASAVGSRLIACVTKVAHATGSSALPCVTRGYVAAVSYDTTVDSLQIARGEPVCPGLLGVARNCNAAASTSRVISLDTVAPNTTGTIHVIVDAD